MRIPKAIPAAELPSADIKDPSVNMVKIFVHNLFKVHLS